MEARRAQGVTLVELLACLAVLALVLGMGLPALATWVRQVRVGAAAMEFGQVLNAGRYLALAENDFVTLCPYQEPDGRCVTRWGGRVKLFVDINANGQQDGADRLLHGNLVLPDGIWLEWRSFRSRPHIQWAPFGRTNSLNGTFTLCNRDGRVQWLRQWVISKAGRVRELQPALAGGAQLRGALGACR